MEVGRRDDAGVYEGVEAVDDELRTAKAEHRGDFCALGVDMLHEECEDDGFPVHFG